MAGVAWLRHAACALLAFVAACSGNGQGLDSNGRPLGSSGGTIGGAVTADFQSIQDNVFTPICSACHVGANAPQGLRLDAASSYALLVGVPSSESPSLLRIKPGDPDNSYLVQKIEGLAAVGARMPFGQAPLPQATINAIRQWVSDGAAPPVAVAPAAPLRVNTTAPLPMEVLSTSPAHIVISFSRELDVSLVNSTTVQLQRMSGAGAPQPGAGEPVNAVASVSPANPSTLLITPSQPLEAGQYQILLRGSGSAALADTDSHVLGADGFAGAGADFTLMFAVQGAP
jgi:hypothetical protein